MEDDAGPTARVLVIDDDHDVAESFRLLMETLGTTVLVAYDGSSGIAAIPDFKPDAIFCDIGMPGIDGYETCRRIRRETDRPIMIVAVTGWGQPQDKQRRSRRDSTRI